MTTVTMEVNRPAPAVFAYATDPTTFHEWQQGVTSGTLESHGTPQLGDRCLTVRHIGGARRPSTSELVRFDPPRAWSVRGIDGPIRTRVDVTVEPLSDSRSRLAIAVDFDGHGLGRLLVPLVVRRQARGEMPENLARLKQRVEARL
ncbi:SRPBCC family protein [Terrabacter sp. NPDC080008]|uniref:SRPBCC family protein n=1 Tax=Terrabacter sp. NPDC080008 TaxID=3155176 RepID=UPI00344BDBBC